MEVVVFRVRTRPDHDAAEYGRLFEQMLGKVQDVPGFIDISGFAGEDGTELALVRFETPEAVAQWRDHPDHVATRERGRAEFYDSYDITVATVSRSYDWARSTTAQA
jgi:heme-degrading monooxygenase HmoA